MLPCRVRLKRALPALATVVVTTSLQALGALPALAASQRVGVWLTNSPSPLYYDAGLIEKAVGELDAAGFNTLYPNVWSRGYTFHRSRFAPIEPKLKQVNASLDPICRITKAGQRRGMKVIPWFEYGLMEPADAEVVRRHPEWVLHRSDGSTLYAMHGANLKTSPLKDLRVWLNPAHPGVRERVIGLIGEIVKRCGVDGIQLDDHFAWPVELGYDAYTRALFRKDKGREPPRDYNNREWMTWRRQQLTGLLRELRARMKSERSGAVISHSPGPFRFAYNHWLQDWEIWALGQLVDELVVQNYAYSVAGFTKDLDQSALVKARRWGMPVQIGVLAGFGGRTTSTAVLKQKVEQVSRRGLGVIYFYWEGLWGTYGGPEGATARRSSFQRLHGALYPDPSPRSSRPRL
ncbi:family 10 glycosylhydrolase [Synechococcus sp. BSF8S]|nr:family 10 glycosylhydrolase [Synechococcus sp. BSF8S]